MSAPPPMSDSLPSGSDAPLPRRARAPMWFLVGGLVFAAVAAVLEPSRALQTDAQTTPTMVPHSGSTADSNGRMIAVTGVDITGSSILYLVDTVSEQIAIYQANGGGTSTQGVRFVGARNISLDLQLDGFNDRTQLDGKPLGYKDLKQRFESEGHQVSDD